MEISRRRGMFTGPDGRIKVAVVKVADSKKLLKTSVKHLFAIEVKSQVDVLSERECSPVQSDQKSNLVVTGQRPRRRAALDEKCFSRTRS